jgi:tetratricopeptide (TPR) repeat protein
MTSQVLELRGTLIGAVAGTVVALSAAGLAFAAGDDSKDTSSDTPTCEQGLVYDPETKTCIEQQSGIIGDDALADYAYALAKEERYNEALRVLDLAASSDNAKVLNYRGFVTRKLGDVDGGIGYYLAGLQLDPNYVQLREYLGEAYVTKGRLDLAREQLAAIEGLCGTDCEHYVQLAAHIDGNPLPPNW